MFRVIAEAFKNPEIRKKILITLALLAVYRLGCWLPIPGVDGTLYAGAFDAGSANSFLQLLSSITGGALQNATVLAIGVSPYINASIIMQLLTIAIPALEKMSKEGESGRKKITQITRYVTVLLAIAQAVGIALSFKNEGALSTAIFQVKMPEWILIVLVIIILVAGAVFTMWLGERITELGIGNGISLLIFIGILSTAGLALVQQIVQITTSEGDAQMFKVWELIAFLVMVLAIFAFIVFIDLAERRIPISYAKQIKGRKQYGGQNTNIPIKVNASGVLPIIFATALISFPQLIASLFAPDSAFEKWWSTWLGTGRPGSVPSYTYIIAVAFLIFFFSFFYAQVQFNPEEVSKNIQQYGGFIPGIRPGQPTTDHLKKISNRITLFGAIFLAIIALVPTLIITIVLNAVGGGGSTLLVNAFTATGMMIVVSVALEFEKQLDSLLMMKQYKNKGFLK